MRCWLTIGWHTDRDVKFEEPKNSEPEKVVRVLANGTRIEGVSYSQSLGYTESWRSHWTLNVFGRELARFRSRSETFGKFKSEACVYPRADRFEIWHTDLPGVQAVTGRGINSGLGSNCEKWTIRWQ